MEKHTKSDLETTGLSGLDSSVETASQDIKNTHQLRTPDPVSTVESGLFSDVSEDIDFSMFSPLHYEQNYSYPLVVWLHSQGRNDQRQLMKVMPMVSMRNFAAVAPRGFESKRDRASASVSAPESGVENHQKLEGRSVASLLRPDCDLEWPQTLGFISEAERRVFLAIDRVKSRLNIADRRVFIAGFGDGGTMAARIAMNHPERFAGVISLCGQFPGTHRPLARLTAARKVPVLLAVGRDSMAYSPEMACNDLTLLHTAGMIVSLRQYPCEQQITTEMLGDMNRWIMEEVASGSHS